MRVYRMVQTSMIKLQHLRNTQKIAIHISECVLLLSIMHACLVKGVSVLVHVIVLCVCLSLLCQFPVVDDIICRHFADIAVSLCF